MKDKEKQVNATGRDNFSVTGSGTICCDNPASNSEREQIEEMTKDLKEKLSLCAGVKLLDHQVETIAYELLKKYQPKLPEDSVVFSKDGFDDEIHFASRKGYDLGSKETAEKLIAKIKQFLSYVETVVDDDKYSLYPEIGYKCSKVDDFLDELEKEEVNL